MMRTRTVLKLTTAPLANQQHVSPQTLTFCSCV